MNKLTLSIDKKTVQQAKKIADANGISVSGMFRWFVQSMGTNHKLPADAAKFAQAAPKAGGSKKAGKR